MTEFKFNWNSMKKRIKSWLRDAILIIGVYSIGLIQDYVPNQDIKVLLIILQVAIISITVIIGEFFILVDTKLIELEKDLVDLKKKG